MIALVAGTSFCFGGIAGLSMRSPAATRKKRQSLEKEVVVVHEEPLHWSRDHYRRGLGDLLHRVNHIALIVRDVGYSCSFYTEVIGFQQIRRPNFDRHGVWLTMGNIELHLIKGIPVTEKGQHPADLIVPHISIETSDVKSVGPRLNKMKKKYPDLSWRQNVSVPTAEASREAVFESDHTNDDGKLIQFFVEDPDGYWMEFCNCDELTDFCLGEEAPHQPQYSQDLPGIRIQARARMYIRAKRWIRRGRRALRAQRSPAFLAVDLASSPVHEDDVDEVKLANLVARGNTYGDICQAFSPEELRELLAKAGNDVPTAILMMRQVVIQSGQILQPPSYIVDSAHLQVCEPLRAEAIHNNAWFRPSRARSDSNASRGRRISDAAIQFGRRLSLLMGP